MTYRFELDRKNETWTAYNPNGQQIDSGELPLNDAERKMAILEDKGVSNPVREALQSIIGRDWENNG